MRKYMNLAINEAKYALTEQEVPVGCIVVKDDKILSHAHNKTKQEKNPLAHAEILAIKQAAEKLHTENLSGCTIYVTLEPCPMCMGAIILSKISTLVYGASDYTFGAAGSVFNLSTHPYAKSLIIYRGIAETPCQNLLREFFQSIR